MVQLADFFDQPGNILLDIIAFLWLTVTFDGGEVYFKCMLLKREAR